MNTDLGLQGLRGTGKGALWSDARLGVGVSTRRVTLAPHPI